MDFNKMFNALNKSGVTGGLAGGALAGALMNKSGRKLAGNALKIGGIAAVGGLAFRAYQNYQNDQSTVSVAAESGSARYRSPAQHHPVWNQISEERFELKSNSDSVGLVLVRAMIAAANADGHIDSDERDKIFAQVEQQNLSAEEKGTLFDVLSKPDSLEQICALTNEPALAAEIYAISAMTVDASSTTSKFYLQALANRLKLPEDLVTNIHAELVT